MLECCCSASASSSHVIVTRRGAVLSTLKLIDNPNNKENYQSVWRIGYEPITGSVKPSVQNSRWSDFVSVGPLSGHCPWQ